MGELGKGSRVVEGKDEVVRFAFLELSALLCVLFSLLTFPTRYDQFMP